jgi:hypothetical protein
LKDNTPRIQIDGWLCAAKHEQKLVVYLVEDEYLVTAYEDGMLQMIPFL